MAAHFSDEFEEFRARALSGGSLFSLSQLLLEQAASDPPPPTASVQRFVSGANTLGEHLLSADAATYCLPPGGEDFEPGSPPGQRHPPPRDVPTVVLGHEDATPSPPEAEAGLDVAEAKTAVSGSDGATRPGYAPMSPPLDPLCHFRHRHSSGSDTPSTGGGEGVCAGSVRVQAEDHIPSHNWMAADPDWALGDMRPRVSSMPTQTRQRSPQRPSPLCMHHAADPHQHRVRSFAITPGGVVSHGELVAPDAAPASAAPGNGADRSAVPDDLPGYRVLVSGEPGVGKRALVHSFSCPDVDPIAMASFDDDDDANHTVFILLDGVQSSLEFVDITKQGVSGAEAADCYMVVYSVEWRHSFDVAVTQVAQVLKVAPPGPIILVANKADLVRNRVVSEQEGRAAANQFDCKYTEVSAAIDHRVDDLLVGILMQIRLTKQLSRSASIKERHGSGSPRRVLPLLDPERACCHLLRAQTGVLGRLFRVVHAGSKSCDNLYEL